MKSDFDMERDPECNDEISLLEEILDDIAEWMERAHDERRELHKLEQELEEKLSRREITPYAHDIEVETIFRSHQDIDNRLRGLEHQRKLTIDTIEIFRNL